MKVSRAINTQSMSALAKVSFIGLAVAAAVTLWPANDLQLTPDVAERKTAAITATAGHTSRNATSKLISHETTSDEPVIDGANLKQRLIKALQENPANTQTPSDRAENNRADDQTGKLANNLNEYNNTLSVDALPSVIALTNYSDTLRTMHFLTTSASAAELNKYLQQFRSDTAKEGYPPAVFRAAYERLAELDFDETLDNILIKIDDSESESAYWDHLALSILADQQPEYVASSIALVSSVFKTAGSKQALNELSVAVDPATVAQQALQQVELSDGERSSYALLGQALQSWILKEPELALAFVQSEIDDESTRQEITNEMLIHWMDNAPATARPTIEAVLNTELSAEPDVFLELADVYLTQRSNTDPAGAMNWLQAQQSSYVRESMLDSVLRPWLEQDKNAAFNHFAQLDEATAAELIPLALPTLATSLSKDSSALQEAITWSNQLPPALIKQTQQTLISDWISSNPQNGVDWLVQQAQGGESQALVLPAARVLAQQDSAAATRLYDNLSLDMQLQLTGSVINSLARHGEDHARQWLTSQTHPAIIEQGQKVIDELFQET